MIKKMLSFSFVFMLFCTTLVAQDAQMTSITNYNNNVNEMIADDKLHCHRLTLNSNTGTNKIWGNVSKYEENVNCYFEIRDGLVILKKIVVSSNIASRSAYADYLYDESGNPAFCLDFHDVTSGTPPSRYFYLDKQLIALTQNDMTVTKESFSTDNLNDGIEMMRKSLKYKDVFDALVRVQMPTR